MTPEQYQQLIDLLTQNNDSLLQVIRQQTDAITALHNSIHLYNGAVVGFLVGFLFWNIVKGVHKA